jgi:hypothetical protein
MMDFYFSGQGGLLEPDEAQYAGSIGLDGHRALTFIFEACAREGYAMPYFEDFFLNSDQVCAALVLVERHAPVLSTDKQTRQCYHQLLLMLTAAQRRQTGLQCFAD